MFAVTTSELLDSIKKTDSIEQNLHHHKAKNKRIDDKDLNSDDFMIESIVDKVEPLKSDYSMKGKQKFTTEMLEYETQPWNNQPRLIELQAKEFRKAFEEKRYQQNRGTRHGQTAIKNLRQLKTERQYNKTENISLCPQSKCQTEIIMTKMSQKWMKTQKKTTLLQDQLSQLYIKYRALPKKIEQQYKDLYQQQINALQIQLNVEKQLAELERSKNQNMRRDYEKKVRSLEDTIKKGKNQDIAHLQSKLNNKKKIIQTLESQVKRITKMKEQSDTQNVRISRQNDKLKKNYQNLQKQNQQTKKKNNYLQKQLQKKNESIETFQKKLQEVIEKLKLLKQQLIDKDKQIKHQKQEKQSLCEQMDRLSTELEDHKVVNKKLYAIKEMVIQQLIAISKWHHLPQPTANLSKEYFGQLGMSLLNIKYFPDSIILRNLNMRKKDFLVQTLCNFLDTHSFGMQLIYRFDILNPTNFHQYIDNKKNLLMMIELTNGTILAGFSIYALDPEKTVRPGRGLLISLTDQKVYNMRQHPKLPVVSYDNYFYILGNSQIRLKTQQKKVFSNFGIANSTFDNRMDQRTAFLNVKETSNNQLEINTYEFYQLQVDQ